MHFPQGPLGDFITSKPAAQLCTKTHRTGAVQTRCLLDRNSREAEETFSGLSSWCSSLTEIGRKVVGREEATLWGISNALTRGVLVRDYFLCPDRHRMDRAEHTPSLTIQSLNPNSVDWILVSSWRHLFYLFFIRISVIIFHCSWS